MMHGNTKLKFKTYIFFHFVSSYVVWYVASFRQSCVVPCVLFDYLKRVCCSLCRLVPWSSLLSQSVNSCCAHFSKFLHFFSYDVLFHAFLYCVTCPASLWIPYVVLCLLSFHEFLCRVMYSSIPQAPVCCIVYVLLLCVRHCVADLLFHFVRSYVADMLFLCVKCYVADMLFQFVSFCVADMLLQFVGSYFADMLLLCVKCYVADLLFQFVIFYVADMLFLCVKCYVADMLFQFVSSYFADMLFLCVKCYVADLLFQFVSSYFADMLFLCLKCYVADMLFQFMIFCVADMLFLCLKYYVADMLLQSVSSYFADVLFLCVKCYVADMLFHIVSSCAADVLYYFVNSRIVASLLDTTRFISCSTPWAAVIYIYMLLNVFFFCEEWSVIYKPCWWMSRILNFGSFYYSRINLAVCVTISHILLKIKFILKSARVSLMPWRFKRERKKTPTHSLRGRVKRCRAPNGEIKWPFIAAVCSQLRTPVVKMITISRVYLVSCKLGSLHLYLRDYCRLEFYAV